MAHLELACKICKHVFPRDVTTGVAAAHMEIEHNATAIEFELVVLCPKCNQIMEFSHMSPSARTRKISVWQCIPCKRQQTLRQDIADK